MGKTIVYGAGRELINIIKSNDFIKQKINFICDGNKNMEGKEVCGFIVQSNSLITDLNEEDTVVIASRKFFEEIQKDILKINEKIKCISLDEYLNNTFPKKWTCNLCNRELAYWLPSGKKVDTRYAIIGNNERYGTCPYCNSLDRNRWVNIVLENFTYIYDRKCNVLHFAPEPQIEKLIRQHENISYITGDIEEGRADWVIDITNIQFENNKFDFIIANHVLEHILDEEAAIKEMKRCIKDEGMLILSFPITMEINTIENTKYKTESQKEKYYGQKDHVRLYGKDYREHFEKYNLNVHEYLPQDILNAEMIEKLRLIKNDRVLLCKKKVD